MSATEAEQAIKAGGRVFVLFYASWCPFSRRFLPIYEKCTKGAATPCLRVMIDDRDDLCEEYDIEVYPTVLFFEGGRVVARLDGEHGRGLSEEQLKRLLNTH